MDVKFLKNNRKYMRAEITRTSNIVNVNLPTLSVEEKVQNLARLRTLQSDLRDFDLKISESLFVEENAESALQAEYDACADYSRSLSLRLQRWKRLYKRRDCVRCEHPARRCAPKSIKATTAPVTGVWTPRGGRLE